MRKPDKLRVEKVWASMSVTMSNCPTPIIFCWSATMSITLFNFMSASMSTSMSATISATMSAHHNVVSTLCEVSETVTKSITYILTNGRSLTDACTSKYHDDDHDLIVFIIIWRHSMTARNASRAWEKLGKKLKLPVCNLLFQMFAKCDDYDLLHIWNLIFGTFTLVTMILKWNSICATPKAPVRWWWSGHWDAEFAFANFHQDLRNVWNKICVMLKPWFAHWSSHA